MARREFRCGICRVSFYGKCGFMRHVRELHGKLDSQCELSNTMAIDFTIPTSFIEGRSAIIMGLFSDSQKDAFLEAESHDPVSGFLEAMRALFLDPGRPNLHVISVSDPKSDFIWIYDKKSKDWKRYFAKIVVADLLRSFSLFKKQHTDKLIAAKRAVTSVRGGSLDPEILVQEASRIYGIFHEDLARDGFMENVFSVLNLIAETHGTSRVALRKDLKMRSFEPLDLSTDPVPYVPLQAQQKLEVDVIPYSRDCTYNIDYLTHDDFVDVFRSGRAGFARLVQRIHFNEAHPENHNQLMLDTDDGDVKCYDGSALVYYRGDLLPVETISRTRALVQRYAAEHSNELRGSMSFGDFVDGERFLDNAELDDDLFTLVMGVYDKGKAVVRGTLGPIL